MRISSIVILGFVALLSAFAQPRSGATPHFVVSTVRNRVKNFGQFNLQHVTVNSAFAKDDGNRKAAKKIDERLQLILGAQLFRLGER